MATECRCGGGSLVGDAPDFFTEAGTSGGARFGGGRLDKGLSGPWKPNMWVAEGTKWISQAWLRREVMWEGVLSEAWWAGDDIGKNPGGGCGRQSDQNSVRERGDWAQGPQ